MMMMMMMMHKYKFQIGTKYKGVWTLFVLFQFLPWTNIGPISIILNSLNISWSIFFSSKPDRNVLKFSSKDNHIIS